MANPTFLSKNYLTADCTINVSSGSAVKQYAYDQKKVTVWKSSGETDEDGDYSCSYEVLFYEGSVATARTIDTIVLQGINLKKFKIQYWTGAAYADIAEAVYTTNAASSLRIKLASSVSTLKLNVVMDTTIVAGEEKEIGELWAMLETYELVGPRMKVSQSDYKDGGQYYLASGKLESWLLFNKYSGQFVFDFLTDTQLSELRAIYDEHDTFTFYINNVRDVDSIYLVQWINSFKVEDDTLLKLNSLTMELMEQ